MIHVDWQPEPADFDRTVRQPGRSFLGTCPEPNASEWSAHSYWRRMLPRLHECYDGICAYSCHYIPYDTGADTVEHFKPKSRHSDMAFEWDNYRLVCQTLNGRKGIQEDVLDPFEVVNGWFVLDFPSLLVRPADELDPEEACAVQNTIDRLRLNDEGTCLRARLSWLGAYCSGDISLSFLGRRAPFIAMELERQCLVTEIRNVMSFGPS